MTDETTAQEAAETAAETAQDVAGETGEEAREPSVVDEMRGVGEHFAAALRAARFGGRVPACTGRYNGTAFVFKRSARVLQSTVTSVSSRGMA